MPVYEVLHAVGEWSVKLREETPIAVRDAITVPFGHLVITSTHLPVDRFTGSQILNAALYSGVCLRPGPGLEISGKGLAWWLDQAVLETAVTGNAESLSWWLNEILSADSGTYPVSITSGLAATVVGTLSTSFQWITRRQAIDTVVRYYWGLEWRINPDFDLVADSVSAIYGADPVALIAARADGYEQASGLWGLSGQARTAIDYESYATRVVAVGQDQIGGATITAPYYDPQGNPLAIGRLVDAPSAGQGLATSVAAQVLATLDQPAYDFRLSAERYVISNRAPVGSYVNVYDPLNGFVDPSNPVRFGGVTYFPKVVRLVGCRWPIEQGMGVYYRWYDPDDGSGPFFTDLTDYVEWESGSAELEVGTRMRGLDGSESSLATLASSPVDSGGWTAYAPSVTGFTSASAEGWYRQDGATLFLSVEVVVTTAGVGEYTVSLPDGFTSAARRQTLSGALYESSSVIHPLMGWVQPSDTLVYGLTTSSAFLEDGSPVTGSGVTIVYTGVIEVDIVATETVAPVLGSIADFNQVYGSISGYYVESIVPTLTSGTLPMTWTASNLPTGMTIDAATGLISGALGDTLASGTATVTATNAAGSDSDSFDWTIGYTPYPAPVSGGNNVLAWTVGVPVSVSWTLLQGEPTLTWTLFSGTLPPGTTLNSSTGVISGTPTTPGTYFPTINVANSYGNINAPGPGWTIVVT